MSNDRFVSYAQNLEDVMLWRALGAAVPEGGFYIDVGASDPTLLSVTRAFCERGWRGVNIEPLPEQADSLRQARPRDVVVQAAVAARPGQRAFYRVTKFEQTGLSTFDAAEAARHAADGAAVEAIEAPVTTLAQICRAHIDGPVHFLKIDAEGAEAEVLAGADFTAVRPWIVLVEATGPLTEADTSTAWEPILLEARYDRVWFDGLNRYYLAREHAALARHFRVPPNIFDAYVQHDGPLMAHVARVEALALARYAALDAAQSELSQLRTEMTRARQQAETPAEPGPPPVQAAPGPAPEPEPAPQPEQAPVPVQRGLLRRGAALAYRLVRPVVRPAVWRTRAFFIGPLLEQTIDLRLRIDELRARPPNEKYVTLEPAFTEAMERLMLTLALEDGRDPSPPLLLPPEPVDGLPKPGSGG